MACSSQLGSDPSRLGRFTVKLFVSKAKLGDGSVRDIETDTIVRLEFEFSEIDPQELQIWEEKAVKNVVEKLGESVEVQESPTFLFSPPPPAPPKRPESKHSFSLKYKIFDKIFDSNTNFDTIFDSNTI